MYKRKDKGETITDASENRKSVYRERRHDLPYNLLYSLRVYIYIYVYDDYGWLGALSRYVDRLTNRAK